MSLSAQEIAIARERIWLDEPEDIARLRKVKGARGQGASAVLYAAMKLGQLVVSLNHLREVARHGNVDLDTMKAVADPLLESYAATYGGFYQMTDTASVVRRATMLLRNVESLPEFAAVAGELSLYIGRMDYWVDLLIPWARFGEVFERLHA